MLIIDQMEEALTVLVNHIFSLHFTAYQLLKLTKIYIEIIQILNKNSVYITVYILE